MLRLCLLRHMKTAWALPGQRDIDRTLNEQGISDLAIVRDWIKEHGLAPGHIFCSPAARTRQTLEGILPAIDPAPTTEICEDLYSGFTEEYLDCLKSHDKAETLMIIGHNPTCASLANILAGSGDSQAMSIMSYKYPTGALAVMEFDVEQWSDIRESGGVLTHFLMPKPFRRFG